MKTKIDKINKIHKMDKIKITFWSLVIMFILLAVYFASPFPLESKRKFFPHVAVLAIASTILGFILIYLSIKMKIKRPLKAYLILTGASSAGFVIFSLLHNFVYALGILAENIAILAYLAEIIHTIFFMLALVACPVAFTIGAIGSLYYMWNLKK